MRKIIAMEWITLDGVFDATPEYFSEWFLPYDSPERQEWIRDEIESADTLLIGGTTYQMLAPFWSTQTNDDNGPATKLNSMPKVVVSTTLSEPIWKNTKRIIDSNIASEIKALKESGGGDILITGSATLTASLMEENLVDEFHFLVHPIIYIRGKRFFKDGMPMTKLVHKDTTALAKGVVAMCYQCK